MLFFEDFVVGHTEPYGVLSVDENEMLAFAREFDPQPMHLDGSSEQARMMGGLLASGWFTVSANMRLMVDSLLARSSSMAGPGVSSVRWVKPVRAGDVLTGTFTILDRKASRTKLDRGFVRFLLTLHNRTGELAFEQDCLVMFGRRAPAPVQEGDSAISRPAAEFLPQTSTQEFFGPIEDIPPGAVVRWGDHTFTEEAIVRFGTRFDPQTYHIDRAAGEASHFGGLVASGWHSASAWLRTVIDRWNAIGATTRLPARGPGFGLKDIVWLKPVYAGDVLTYYSKVLDARLSASKPGWGILTQRNYAYNQHGDLVLAFTGTSLWGAGTEAQA
ncbi:MAG TPA: MaoC/PaaZ C-terminal domain-containing protein [Rhabdaerophilum sp.]|nr:MaoC/PaaZ C-terminal domain-containing protein [Rhabdaerophilum sp.]